MKIFTWNYSFKELLIISVTGIVITIVLFYLLPTIHETVCSRYKTDVKNENVKGKVIRKFIDIENHSRKFTEIISNHIDTIKYDLTLDISGIYEYLNVNDSVVKESGNYNFAIKRESKDTVFVLNYDCN